MNSLCFTFQKVQLVDICASGCKRHLRNILGGMCAWVHIFGRKLHLKKKANTPFFFLNWRSVSLSRLD